MAAEHAPDTVTDAFPDWKEIRVELKYPITEGRRGKGKVLHKEVVVYEPDGEAIDMIEKASANESRVGSGVVIATVVALTDLTEAEAKRLHQVDFDRVTAAVETLFREGNDQAEED